MYEMYRTRIGMQLRRDRADLSIMLLCLCTTVLYCNGLPSYSYLCIFNFFVMLARPRPRSIHAPTPAPPGTAQGPGRRPQGARTRAPGGHPLVTHPIHAIPINQSQAAGRSTNRLFKEFRIEPIDRLLLEEREANDER